jgi:hypothetical protein
MSQSDFDSGNKTADFQDDMTANPMPPRFRSNAAPTKKVASVEFNRYAISSQVFSVFRSIQVI